MNDEFYIGWQDKAAPGTRKLTRRVTVVLVLLALVLAVLFARAQRMIGTSVFEWGTHKTFTGILAASPYPRLLVPRPGEIAGQTAWSTYHLVAPWKFGLKPETVAPFDGKPVQLEGTLIYRGNQTMIEALPDTIRESGAPSRLALPRSESLGTVTLQGEIVDSKCYLGVMNPGQLTPHRACAIRCISGGVPPVLLVRQKAGPALYFLLVSAEGKPVNQQVLDLVAEPIEITGMAERQGDLLILRADPATYRRIGSSHSHPQEQNPNLYEQQ